MRHLRTGVNNMYSLTRLFQLCAFEIKYEEIGDDVNYATKTDREENILYIFFQPSNSADDWKNNFDFKEEVYGLFKVHRGFMKCYKQVRNILLDKVYANQYNGVVVVGYSHGGALAQLCHQDLKYHFPKLDVQTFAFESPRCLKVPKKLRFYWEHLTRIETNNDLITHLPPKIFGFNDLGKELKIKGDTSLIKKCLPRCIKSHYPQVVLKALQDYEKKLSIKNEE